MITGAFDLPRAGCLLIGAIDLIPKGTWVISPQIVHLVVGFVKHLPQIWAVGCPPLPKRRTPAPVAGPHEVELWKVVSRDWMKKDYIIKEVPCALILDTANIVYLYASTDVFWDESLHPVPIHRIGVNLSPMSAFFPEQLPSPFCCGYPLEPSVWVGDESISDALALRYSCM